jgi:chemotaxis protein CheX
MHHDQLVTMIRNATVEVFSMMLGSELQAGAAFIDTSAPGPQEGVVALIGLAGDWAGSGILCCKADTARRISGLLLMQEFPAVDEEVLDAVGEVTNMVFGNVKTSLEDETGPMGLSIPTVIYGRNFSTRSVGRNEWTVVPFKMDNGQFEIQLCLTLARQTSYPHRPIHGLALP